MQANELPHVLVTGAAGDIGRGLVSCFLDRGHRVFGIDILPDAPKQTYGHDRFDYCCCDLTDQKATAKAIHSFIEHRGVIGVVVNNVGLIFNGPVVSYVEGKLTKHSMRDWDKVVSVTLSTAFHVTTTCVAQMLEKKEGGLIINISSISAEGNPGQSAYSAAKGAINSMTIAQAKELGGFGIRVAAIAPGFIQTPSTLKAMGNDSLKKLIRNIPLRRLGSVAEVCHAAVFILENQYYTGAVLDLNGGLSI